MHQLCYDLHSGPAHEFGDHISCSPLFCMHTVQPAQLLNDRAEFGIIDKRYAPNDTFQYKITSDNGQVGGARVGGAQKNTAGLHFLVRIPVRGVYTYAVGFWHGE